jgi:hypothetical protein
MPAVWAKIGQVEAATTQMQEGPWTAIVARLGLLSTRALRSLQRRKKIIEERIASEEGYIVDLTILKNLCHWN